MYVPILAAAAGRLAGLGATSEAVKARITPLFDVPRARPASPDIDADAAALERHLAATVDAVATAFGQRRGYLDGGALDGARVPDGRAAAAWLYDEARTRGLPLVPVTGLRRSDAYQLAVAEELVERITQSQKQRDVAARMSYAPNRPVASYIDRGL